MDFDVAYYKQLLDHLAEGVYFTDRERRILYWNHAAENLTGYPADAVLGAFCHDGILQHVDDNDQPLCDAGCPIRQAMETTATVSLRAYLAHRDGHRLPVQIRASPVLTEQGELVGAVEVFADASDQIELETLNQSLRQLIRVDPLTRLPNHRALLDAMQKEYLRFARYGTPFSVILIEIENFNQIVASCGQEAGTETLQWFARKLLGGFRKADMPTRWSAQRFAVLLPNAGGPAAEKAASKVRQQLAGQLCPATGSYVVASFGVAEISRQDSLQRIMKRAERALAQSREKKRGDVVRM